MNIRAFLLLLASSLASHAASFVADSARGQSLFQTLACVQCHSVNATGGSSAPDLGRLVDRAFTPGSLAATMWNHAPTMWASMRERQIPAGQLDTQGAQDLLAFFYASRFFEKPGDAARGKRAFQNRGCAGCHGLTSAIDPKAHPVSEWQGLSDPVVLVEAMWNHRADMVAASEAKGAPTPKLEAQDLSDMLVYLRNLPDNRSKTGVFRIEVTDTGEPVFASAGCAKCHEREVLANRIQGETLTEIAVAMWNHAPRMMANGAPMGPLAPGQMQALVSAFWGVKFFGKSGRANAGASVFTSKNCTVCHNATGAAPQLPFAGQEFTGATMVAVLWKHGPTMLDQMKTKGLAWPRFDGTQMADLIAYLNSKH